MGPQCVGGVVGVTQQSTARAETAQRQGPRRCDVTELVLVVVVSRRHGVDDNVLALERVELLCRQTTREESRGARCCSLLSFLDPPASPPRSPRVPYPRKSLPDQKKGTSGPFAIHRKLQRTRNSTAHCCNIWPSLYADSSLAETPSRWRKIRKKRA